MSEPRRLNLFVCEDAGLPASSECDELQDVGMIYPQPFSAPLSTWSFSARVLGALAEHAWQPTQAGWTLTVVLTPALADGEARVVLEQDVFRKVYVGLPPARWLASTIADKRRILVDICVKQLGSLREAWSLDWPALQAAAKDVVESYATIAAPVGEATAVTLGVELARRLDIAAWAKTAPAARLSVGRAVAERTRASGRALCEPELVTLPTGESVVRATANGIAVVLVPSGRLRRGFDEDQLARLDRIYEKIWCNQDGSALEKRMPRALTPFGADARCQINRADEVDIPAMWIAETTCDIEDERPPWDEGLEDDRRSTTWRRTLAFLAQQRMTLPTSDELLWAASAGDARLFPWGEDAGPIGDLLASEAHVLAEAYGLDDQPYTPQGAGDPFQIFAARNPFGLAATLSHQTWCMPLLDLGDPAPFVRVGGALDFFPWQGGFEAMLFLTRVVSRTAFDGRVGAPRAAVRPIVRLCP